MTGEQFKEFIDKYIETKLLGGEVVDYKKIADALGISKQNLNGKFKSKGLDSVWLEHARQVLADTLTKNDRLNELQLLTTKLSSEFYSPENIDTTTEEDTKALTDLQRAVAKFIKVQKDKEKKQE